MSTRSGGLARLARLDDEADLGARALADEVMVHRRRGEQRRDGRVVAIDTAVGEDEDRVTIGDGAQARPQPQTGQSPGVGVERGAAPNFKERR